MVNCENNSLIFGGIEFGHYGIIDVVERPFIPPIKHYTKEVLGRDGVLYKTNLFEPLVITAKVRLFNNCNCRSLDKDISEIVNSLYTKTTRPLNYKGKRVWYDAVLNDISQYERFINSYAYMELDFLVPSGTGRSEKRRDDYKQVTETKISIESPLPTRPIFRFTGTETKITNMSTGEFLMLKSPSSYNFVIDGEKETIRQKDLNLIKYLDWKSDFFDIKDGDVIKSTNPIDIEFYERYLYER